ncbi:hypothetical protein, partial [Pedobacter sp.]|uniref:hypothetical protein n=1 Tax=Pedobacter sp. TaxID=1411316 RepID=UPI003D7F5C90
MNKPWYKLCLLAFLLVLLPFMGKAQVLESIKQSFNLHNQTVPKEKLYVHTDKEFYLTGELLWFKVYEQRDGASDMFSQVVYV